jgi:nitroreductase
MEAVAVGTGDVVPDETLRVCLLAAMAAPSIHNTQPWLFRLQQGAVEVLVDRRRHLGSLDPTGREMHVSVGAAVFNLVLALRARGWTVETELVPADATTLLDERVAGFADVAARVVVVGPAPAPPAVRALAQAIPRRHTNRRPFRDRPVPTSVIADLAGAAAAEGALLVAADASLRQAVLSLTRTAERHQRDDSDYVAELRRWTSAGGLGRRDGVPRQALGPRDADAALPLRDFAIAHGAPSTVVEFERDPTIVLLMTSGDKPADWLSAGMALQSVLLTATVRGLAATPLSQLTEVPALRDLLTDTVTGEMVQTVLRVGYARHPAAPTPRRALDEVLVDADGKR